MNWGHKTKCIWVDTKGIMSILVYITVDSVLLTFAWNVLIKDVPSIGFLSFVGIMLSIHVLKHVIKR